MRRLANAGLALAAALLITSASRAASHLWEVSQVFSSADGTIQFIEMHNPTSAANETALDNKWVRSVTTGNQYTFQANLPANSTANRYLLLATAGYAALPGAVTPDYIIPANFFDLSQDTIEYWLYAGQELVFTPGELPLDGVTSLLQNGTTQVNFATNFHGQTGSVVVPPDCASDLDGDGTVGINDLLELLANWGKPYGINDLLSLLADWGPC